MKNFTYRYWIVAIQGFLSGLPFAAIANALQARFIAANASVVLVGSLSLIGQVYLYKFLLAPLADSFNPPLISRLRQRNQAWILFNQIGLIVTLSIMAILSAKHTPLWLIFFGLLTALFSAFQDVNIDSFRIKLLRPDELGQGSANYLLGFRVGMLFAGGVSIIIGDKLSWHLSYGLLAGLMFIGMLLTQHDQPISRRTHLKESFYKAFYRACLDLEKRPRIFTLLCFVMLYGLGDAFTIGVNNTFLIREMHLTFTELALYANTLNIAMLLISTIIARYSFKYFKLTTCLVSFSIIQILMLLLYAFSAAVLPNKAIIIAAVLMEGLSGGLIATAIILIISYLTQEPHTTTQYAILSALAALKNVLLGPLAAFFVKHFSWTDLYLLGVVLSAPGTYLVWHLRGYLGTLSESTHARTEILLTTK